LVYHDMLGLNDAFQPTFVKRYAALADTMRQAFSAYAEEVAFGVFPAAAQSFGAITDKGSAT
jgi:3-methyl-2-oxobutanoate hydroxymethyltransferase